MVIVKHSTYVALYRADGPVTLGKMREVFANKSGWLIAGLCAMLHWMNAVPVKNQNRRVKLLAVPVHPLELPEHAPDRKRETFSLEDLNERATRRTHVLEEILSHVQGGRFS